MLKLDAPYNVIYAGGLIGRHIATLVTWTEDDEEQTIVDSVSYPVIDMEDEYPGGKLVTVDLDDCRVLCPPEGTNLLWLGKIVEYDFQQLEPAGPGYILDRMQRLGCEIRLLTDKEGAEILDYKVSLSILPLNASWDEPRLYRVKSNRYTGFYFESEGTADEILIDLEMQLQAYLGAFADRYIKITFYTYDMELEDVISKLNDPDRH
jgi:hypothetical protein